MMSKDREQLQLPLSPDPPGSATWCAFGSVCLRCNLIFSFGSLSVASVLISRDMQARCQLHLFLSLSKPPPHNEEAAGQQGPVVVPVRLPLWSKRLPTSSCFLFLMYLSFM